MSENVKKTEEYILGPENTPFFTTTWQPSHQTPSAYVVFVHGFAEHIGRYDTFFRKLAAEPYNLHIFAFDQRGFGKTSTPPYALTASSPEVKQWKEEGKTVKLERHAKRKSGGWAKAMPDIEWFVKLASTKARETGKKLFLWGFSMGGGEAIGFVTRPQSPPSSETVALLDGVIAGGPLIKLTKPAGWLSLQAGGLAANIGLGSFVIPTHLNYDDLSHNKESNEANRQDPLCEQTGSLRGVSDMLTFGDSLVTSEPLSQIPKDLPLLVYHGGDDHICSPIASKEFVDGCQAKDKTHHIFPGMRHEIHNELEPTPSDCAKLVGDWIAARTGAGEASGQAKL